MNINSQIIEKIKKEPKIMMITLMVLFFGIAWLNSATQPKAAATDNATEESIDTFIPDGFALIPIEIQNPNALTAMVGQFAVVDLYTDDAPQAIATGLRLIRSPKDPSQFGVLVPHSYSQTVARKSIKPLQVVLQNPKQKRTYFQEDKKQKLIWEEKL